MRHRALAAFTSVALLGGFVVGTPRGHAADRLEAAGARQKLEQAIVDPNASFADVLAARHELLTARVEQGGRGLIPVATWGRASEPWDPFAEPGPECADPPDADSDAKVILPLGATDLDGAAGDEVLTVSTTLRNVVEFYLRCPSPTPAEFWPPNGSLRVRDSALDTLWEAPVDNLAYVTFADVDGDGRDDVLTWEEGLIKVPGWSSGAWVLNTRLRARSGLDGRLLWSETIRSTNERVPLIQGMEAVGHTDLPVGLTAGHIAGGAPGGDIMVERLTAQYQGTVGEFAVRGTTFDGASGDVLGEAVAAGVSCLWPCSGALPSASVGPDVNGDGRADLLLIDTASLTSIVSATSLDRSTTFWQRELVEFGLMPYVTDLDGDGTDDIVLADSDLYAYSMAGVVGALDGVTGATLWMTAPRFDEGIVPALLHVGIGYGWTPVADLDGDGGTDLLIHDRQEGVDLAFRSLSGATGETIASSGHDLPDEWLDYAPNAGPRIDVVMCGTCRGHDLTGDGHSDILVAGRFGSAPEVPTETHYIVIDGVTGAEVRWHSSTLTNLWPGVGDLDGDGAGDLAGLDYLSGSLGVEMATAIGGHPTGVELTTRAELWPGIPMVRPLSADQDGAGRREVLVGFRESHSTTGDRAVTASVDLDGIRWQIYNKP